MCLRFPTLHGDAAVFSDQDESISLTFPVALAQCSDDGDCNGGVCRFEDYDNATYCTGCQAGTTGPMCNRESLSPHTAAGAHLTEPTRSGHQRAPLTRVELLTHHFTQPHVSQHEAVQAAWTHKQSWL